jgi:hypothetical protein
MSQIRDSLKGDWCDMHYNIDEFNSTVKGFRSAPVSLVQRVMSDASQSSMTRRAAVYVIASCKLPPIERSRLLLELVDDADEDIQTQAITLLGELVDCGGVKERLRSVVAWSRGQPHFVALRSLAQLGDDTVLDDCRKLLLQGPKASMEAVILLGFLRNSESRAMLIELLNSSTAGAIREFTARALARHGSQLAIPILEEALCRGDPWNRAAKAGLLVTLGRISGWVELGHLVDEAPECEMPALVGWLYKGTGTMILPSADKVAARAWIDQQLRDNQKDNHGSQAPAL